MQTTAFGVAYLETRFEVLIGTYATAQLVAEHHADYEAVEANVLTGRLTGWHPCTPLPRDTTTLLYPLSARRT